jgi:hypothetical protein
MIEGKMSPRHFWTIVIRIQGPKRNGNFLNISSCSISDDLTSQATYRKRKWRMRRWDACLLTQVVT